MPNRLEVSETASAQTASAIASVSTMWGRHWNSVSALLLKTNLHWLVSRCWVSLVNLEIRVLRNAVDTEFPYRVRIVDMGLIAATLFADTVSDSQIIIPGKRITVFPIPPVTRRYGKNLVNNLGAGLFYLPGISGQISGQILGHISQTFPKFRFKFRVFFRQLHSENDNRSARLKRGEKRGKCQKHANSVLWTLWALRPQIHAEFRRIRGKTHVDRPIFSCMVCMRAALHESDGNHENDENDEENSDSYKQGVESWKSWIRRNHRNHENDENHGNPGHKPVKVQIVL